MERTNRKEYELIKSEIRDLKNCTTDYVAFVFRGTGLSVFVIAVLKYLDLSSLYLCYINLALSMLVTLVLFVLFYKFNSHNCYAGYCRLLSEEYWTKSKCGYDDLFLWEPCFASMHALEIDPKRLEKVFEDELVILSSKHARTKAEKISKPLSQLWHLARLILTGRSDSESWSFPMWISIVLFFLAFLYVLFGGVLLYETFNNGSQTISNGMNLPDEEKGGSVTASVLVFPAIIVLILFYVWFRLLDKLYNLMYGLATVESYCRLFQRERGKLLKLYGVDAEFLRDTDVPDEFAANAAIADSNPGDVNNLADAVRVFVLALGYESVSETGSVVFGHDSSDEIRVLNWGRFKRSKKLKEQVRQIEKDISDVIFGEPSSGTKEYAKKLVSDFFNVAKNTGSRINVTLGLFLVIKTQNDTNTETIFYAKKLTIQDRLILEKDEFLLLKNDEIFNKISDLEKIHSQ